MDGENPGCAIVAAVAFLFVAAELTSAAFNSSDSDEKPGIARVQILNDKINRSCMHGLALNTLTLGQEQVIAECQDALKSRTTGADGGAWNFQNTSDTWLAFKGEYVPGAANFNVAVQNIREAMPVLEAKLALVKKLDQAVNSVEEYRNLPRTYVLSGPDLIDITLVHMSGEKQTIRLDYANHHATLYQGDSVFNRQTYTLVYGAFAMGFGSITSDPVQEVTGPAFSDQSLDCGAKVADRSATLLRVYDAVEGPLSRAGTQEVNHFRDDSVLNQKGYGTIFPHIG